MYGVAPEHVSRWIAPPPPRRDVSAAAPGAKSKNRLRVRRFIVSGRLFPFFFPRISSLFYMFLLFWGSLCFPLPGKEDVFFAGVLIPAKFGMSFPSSANRQGALVFPCQLGF